MISTPHLLWSLVVLGLIALGYLLREFFPVPQVRELLQDWLDVPLPEGELRASLRRLLQAPPTASDADLLDEVRRGTWERARLARMESVIIEAADAIHVVKRLSGEAVDRRALVQSIEEALAGDPAGWQGCLIEVRDVLRHG